MGSWYLLGDVRSVQAFVFESDRLAQMRGASRLLLDLDDEVRRASECGGGTVENALGGTYRVAFADEPPARAVEAAVRTKFVELTGLEPARFTTVVAGPDVAYEQRYGQLAAAKRSAPPSGMSAGPGILRACEVCAWRPAEERVTLTGGDRAAVCSVCSRRNRAARSRRGDPARDLWATLGLEDDKGPRDLAALAAGSRPPGYMAVLVADGNRVGEHLRAAGEASSQALSQALAEAVREGVCEAAARARSLGSSLIPQWVGGDDVVLAAQAQAGLRAAQALLGCFASTVSARGQREITMSAGVVIAHASHPFSAVLSLGHQLLEAAKAASRADEGRSYVDFVKVHASVAEDLALARRDRPARPLPLGGATFDLEWLLQAAEHLVAAEVPRRAVRALHPGSPPPVLEDPVAQEVFDAAWRQGRVYELVDAFELAREARCA